MLTREITFPVRADRLWSALTEPASVSAWFGAEVDGELVAGSQVIFRNPSDGNRFGHVDDVDPGRRLAFRWWPETDIDDESEVIYELEPTGDSTRLTVIERRLPRRDAPGSARSEGSASCSISATAWSAWDERLVGLWGLTRSLELVGVSSLGG